MKHIMLTVPEFINLIINLIIFRPMKVTLTGVCRFLIARAMIHISGICCEYIIIITLYVYCYLTGKMLRRCHLSPARFIIESIWKITLSIKITAQVFRIKE